jgi:hypothetical protein
MTPLEKAENAVFDKLWQQPEWGLDEELCRDIARIAPRAVISSIEVDDTMVEAFSLEYCGETCQQDSLAGWRKVVRAALKAFLRSLLEGNAK